jgi:murein L,D-transpeptidase YafK
LKPYRQSGFQNSGEKISSRFAEADRLEAGGFNPLGGKSIEGDGKTPEGVFKIDRRNPNSKFHLSLGIDYPRPEDRAQAETLGQSPGGDIFIHGQPNRLAGLGTLPYDWTAGCISVSDGEIEEIWRVTPIGTVVEILP